MSLTTRQVGWAIRFLRRENLVEKGQEVFCKDGQWRATWKVKV